MNTDTSTGDGALDSGAGSDPQETQNDLQTQTPEPSDGQQQEPKESNPFDFMNMPEEKEAASEEQESEEGEQQEEEAYELDLGESFDGNPDTRNLLTTAAKAAGVPAKAAGDFVQAVCHELAEQQAAKEKAANEALQTRWGRSYGANMNAAGRYLQQVAKEEGFTQEEIAQCMNPVVFKLALRAAKAEGEGRAGKGGAPVSNKQMFDSILGDESNEKHKILMQPNHARYRETADYMNGLIGMKVF